MSIHIECERCKEKLDDRDFAEEKEKITCWKCGWSKTHIKPIKFSDLEDWYYNYMAAGFDFCSD